MSNLNKTGMSCKLTTPELKQRKATVITAIKGLIREKRELSNGYSYQFDGSDETIDLLTDFVKTERQCCDFFNFSIDVNNDRTAWLKITGDEGVKNFSPPNLNYVYSNKLVF
jgi:hypothetical protein